MTSDTPVPWVQHRRLPCSPGQARKMIERAIGAGMIAPGRRGRPPSIARPRATTTKETP